MGAGQYVPALGRFLSVEGGNVNDYNCPNDPVNGTDFGGRSLDPEPPVRFLGYSYDYEWMIGSVSTYGGAAAAMSVLASDPSAIFPFPISGCASLSQGSSRTLAALGNLPDSVGTLNVSRAATTVRLTVVSGAISTIPLRRLLLEPLSAEAIYSYSSKRGRSD